MIRIAMFLQKQRKENIVFQCFESECDSYVDILYGSRSVFRMVLKYFQFSV